MGPERRSPLKFFRVAKTEDKASCAIVYGSKGNEHYYDSFTGIVKDIVYQEKEVDFQKDGKKTKVRQYNIKFDCGDVVEHVWAVDVDSNLLVNFINSIAGMHDITQPIEMSVYLKNGYSNIWLKSNGTDLRWKYPVDVIPKPVALYVEGEPVLDPKTGRQMYSFAKRREWLAQEVQKIVAKLRAVELDDSPDVLEEEIIDDGVAF